MKKAGKIVFWIVAALVLIPAAAAFIIQIPSVQTFAVQKVAEFLSKDIDGEITVGHVSIAPLHTAIINDVCLKDSQGDTIVFAGTLKANLSSKSVLSGDKLIVHRLILDDAKADIRYISPEETNIGHIIAQFSPEKDKENSGALPWEKITVRKVRVKNLDFSLNNDFAEAGKEGKIDFNHLDVKGLNLKMDDISYAGPNAISASLSSLSFKEENSGFELKDLSCRASLSSGGIKVHDLHYDDGESVLDADCSLGFKSFKDFSAFTDNVPMSLHLNRTLVDVSTAKAFVNGLDDINLKVWLSGDFEGTVSNLNAENVKIESESGETTISMDAALKGLPDVNDATADIGNLTVVTNTSDLGRILASVIRDFKAESIAAYAPGEQFTLKGNLHGPLSDFKTEINLSGPHYGEATASARLAGMTGGKDKRISGSLSGKSLAVGKFLKDTTIGHLTFDADLNASFGRKLYARVDRLDIDDFGFKGYNYSGISASGTYDDGNAAFKIKDNDPNLTLSAEALAKLGDKRTSTFLAANIEVERADLAALHLDKREVCLVNGSAKANVELTKDGTALGKADITGLHGRLQEGSYNLGDMMLKAAINSGRYNIQLDSKLAEASYEGPETLGSVVSDIKTILSRELGNVLKMGQGASKPDKGERTCTLTLKAGDLKPLTAFLMPDLLVSEGTELRADLHGSESMAVTATSPLIAIGDKYIKKIELNASSDGGPIRAGVKAGLLQFGDFILRNNAIVADIQDNLVKFNLTFDNKDKEKRNGKLFADIAFPSGDGNGYLAIADIKPSHVELEDCTFRIDPTRISYKDKYIDVKHLRMHVGDGQYISANGVVSASPSDTVGVILKDIDVSLLNNLLGNDIKLNGVFNGTATGIGLLGKQMGLLADISASSLAVNDEQLGDLRILCRKDEENSDRYNLLLANSLDGRKPVNASGYFMPKGKKLGIEASLDQLAVSWLDPLLTGIVTDMGGSLSGEIKAEGPLDKLSISGKETRFNDLACTVDFTKVPYVINGPFSITEKGITFQNDTIMDSYGNLGRVSGGVSYDCFKDIRLGVNFRLRNMQALNTTAADEENGFYGRVFGTGTVGINGPTDKIQIDVNLRTGDGAVHIPLNSSESEKKSILTFVDNRLPVFDEYDSLIVSKKAVSDEKSESSLGVKVKLNITNQTEVGLDINRSLGDMLKARGAGNVEINVTPTLFDIKGGYNVEEGSYKFALMGITSKDFIINPGGTINFNGDIMQSDLDLTATYRTKASISSLIADSTSVNSRRTVNCGIGIGGKLANPQLNFNIDIPDLDPTTQGLVQSALSTEEKRLKQFLALLVSGSFVPDESSGIVNNTTVLYSNASEIMANQVNNIFRQLDIPLDLGFNYQPGTGGTDIFDVAISTQLFNNRVSINGNIGNQDYSASSASEVVGNVDVEIKMNKSGRLRLNLFSHAADRYSNYLDQTQRNGAGMVYQQEFDTWQELWRKIFRRRGAVVPGTLPRDSSGRNLLPAADTIRTGRAGL